MTAELEERIVSLHREGRSQESIGRVVGIGQRRISALLRSRGLYSGPTYRGGMRHPLWKGGRSIHADGYRLIALMPGDPMWSMTRNGYVLEHRLVMARHIGRPLSRHETVHHVNGDRADNRIENLQLRVGRHGNGVAYECADCGSHNIRPIQLAEVI